MLCLQDSSWRQREKKITNTRTLLPHADRQAESCRAEFSTTPSMHEYKHEIWILAKHPKYVITRLRRWTRSHSHCRLHAEGLNAPIGLIVQLFTLQLRRHRQLAGPRVTRTHSGGRRATCRTVSESIWMQLVSACGTIFKLLCSWKLTNW